MTKNINTLEEIDVDKAWGEIYTRLHKEGLIPNEGTYGKARFIPVWLRWAAAILLLLSTGLFFLSRMQTTTPHLSETTVNYLEQQTLVHILDDGSIVYLAEKASLKYPADMSDGPRIVRLSGEAFFDVANKPDQEFIVEAGDFRVEVVGTAFNVKTGENDYVELFVEEGIVRVGHKSLRAHSIEAYQGEVVTSGENNSLDKSMAPNLLLSSWRTNRMHFKDETLGHVLTVINKNFGSHLFIEKQELMERRITVTFYNNALPTIIELLCLSMNLDVEICDNNSILLKPKT